MYRSVLCNVMNQKIMQMVVHFLFMDKFKTSWFGFQRSVSCDKCIFFHSDSKREGIYFLF